MCLCASPVTLLSDDQLYSLNLTANYTQDASTGATVLPGPGCPLSAIKDPYEADFCPLTNVIHPNFNSEKCVTVPAYANGVKVEMYVACLNHLTIV